MRPDGAGGFTVTDGPFAETKEALGGYYLVEADGSRRGDRDRQAGARCSRGGARGPADHGVQSDRDRSASAAVAAAVADAHRREWGFVLAATVRVTRDIDLAEECVQDAYAQALRGLGRARASRADPAAWLTTTARNRALDLLRRDTRLRRLLCR